MLNAECSQPVDDEVREVVKAVQSEIHAKLGVAKDVAHEVLGYAKQVVAGTNFFVKVHFKTAGEGKIAHLRIHRDLAGKVSLVSVKDNQTRVEAITFFD